MAEQPHRLAHVHRERHVVEGEEILGSTPPAEDSFLDRAGPVVAELELFGDPVDLNRYPPHQSSSPKSPSRRLNSDNAPANSTTTNTATTPRRPRYQLMPASSGNAPGSCGLYRVR